MVVDFFVSGDGEVPFSKLLENLERFDFSIEEFKQSQTKIPGVHYFHNNQMIYENRCNRIAPAEISSPCLTGLFDSFLQEGLYPTIQFTRGCPFSCAYCTEGHTYYSKVQRFSLKQFEQEITYISDNKCSNENRLMVVDSSLECIKMTLKLPG